MMPRRVTEVLECDLCGEKREVESATLTIEGETYELLLCPADRKKTARIWRGKGTPISSRSAPSEAHEVKPFKFVPPGN